MSIVVRRARASDKRPLMKFVRKVWGGHDYIPSVWDTWLHDKGSVMDVIEVNGRQVGMGRLKFLDDGVGWLEGARIDPQFRGRGLATMLGQDLMRTGMDRGATKFRLASRSGNRAAHRQIGKLGLLEIARVSVYEVQSGVRFRPQKDVWQASEQERPRMERMIRDSREYKAGGGVYWDGFEATELEPKVLAGLVRKGSVYLTDGAVAVASTGGEGGGTWRQVCFVAGVPERAVKLVTHIFGRKEAVRTTWKIAYVPQGSRLISALRAMGLRRSSSLVLFESPASKD